MIREVTIDRFFGGISNSDKEGPDEGSHTFNRSLDIRSDPATISLLPKTTKESGSTVTDLVKDFEPVETDMYSYGTDGKIYKRTSAASWSNIRTAPSSSGNGLGYFSLDDFLYYATDTVIGRYGPIAGSPTFDDDFFTNDSFDLDQSSTETGSTYTTATSITENATNQQDFIPARDPQVTVEIDVDTVGSGDWTLKVHDPDDTEVFTKTIVNGSMSTDAIKFTGTIWTPVLGVTYHFHVTTTVADGKITTGTASDLNTCTFKTLYQVLVTDTDFHPIVQHLEFLAIGNGRYVATWDGILGGGNTNYNAHKLKLHPGFKVRDLETNGEYLIIVAWRGSAVTDFEEGRLYFWNGTGSTYNFWIPIKEGTITSSVSEEGRFYYITTKGNIYEYNGQINKIHSIPKLARNEYLEVNPGAMTMWQGLIRIGVATNSDSTTLEKGVYTWGTRNLDYPESLSYDYPISEGTRTGTTLKIGAVGAIADTLFISYDDNGTFGVDTVTTSANPFADGSYESLKHDNRKPWKTKQALKVVASHTALASGESIQLGHKINRASSFTTNTANSTSSDTESEFEIDLPYKEIELQAIPAATGSTTPTITSLLFKFNDNEGEEHPGE